MISLRKKIRFLPLICLPVLLLAACAGKPDTPETVSESVSSGEQSEVLPLTGDETGEEPPASEPGPESEPENAKERMEKLVRDEYGLLKAELEEEKKTDPVFDETREPDPADKALLSELRAERRKLGYKLREIDEYEDPASYDALAREAYALDLRIEELSLRTLPAGYSKTREDARKDYASYAYFRKPGHPFSSFVSMTHRVLYFDAIEALASRSHPYLPDLAPVEENQTAFTAGGIDLIHEGNSFAVIMEVDEVFWGKLTPGDRIAFRVDGKENAETVRDAAGWLLFAREGDEKVSYEGKELPSFWAFSEMGYEILEDGTLLSCTRLGEFHKLDGLTPEEACRLVLRTFMKYGDLRGKSAKLLMENPAA